MTRPPFRTLPLLVHSLAAAFLCPIALAKPKATPQKQKQPETETEKKPAASPAAPATPARPFSKMTTDQKQAAVRAAVAAGKAAASATQKNGTPAPASTKTPAAANSVARATAPATVVTQTQGDRPTGKGTAPKSPQFAIIADPAELLARVPSSGPLGEEHLILHAIATDPQLALRRAAIASKRADRQAIKDWENPELRLSYGSQDDNYVGHPYTERTIEQFNSNETSTGTDTTTPAPGSTGATIFDTNNSLTSTDRYREIVRTITPQKNGGETVVTDVYELRTETENGTRDRLDPASRTDILESHVIRELKSHAVENTTSTRGSNGSDSFAALMRFKIPNLWEKKARLQRASAEIMLAEGQYLADEDRLVREVRERYEALSTLEGALASNKRIKETYSSFQKELQTFELPEFEEEIAGAGLDVHKTQLDIYKMDADIQRTRAELAHYCNLSDVSRIRSGATTRRIVDPSTLDADYLVEIGMLYRSDAVESRGRLEIAKAYLAEAKAAKIPWASFIDAGWSREWSDDRSGNQDEWTVRIAFNFPLWEWSGINKKSKEYKKAADSWQLQFERQKEHVRNDVTLAISRLRTAAGLLNHYDKELRELRAEAGESLPKIEQAMKKTGDLAKLKRTKYRFEVQEHETEIRHYSAYSDYNQALMFLEDAIGVRIEKALNGTSRD